jgi:hypothetical protein
MYRRFYFRPKTLLDYGVRLAFSPDVLYATIKAGIKVFKYSFLNMNATVRSHSEKNNG